MSGCVGCRAGLPIVSGHHIGRGDDARGALRCQNPQGAPKKCTSYSEHSTIRVECPRCEWKSAGHVDLSEATKAFEQHPCICTCAVCGRRLPGRTTQRDDGVTVFACFGCVGTFDEENDETKQRRRRRR